MKEELSLRQSRRLKHTRANWNLMTALAKWSISDAGGSSKVFGEKPQVADYVPTDLGVESGRAVEENIKNMPEIEALLNRILPGYSDMVATGAKTTQSLLRGELPKDVQDAVRRSTAYQSLTGGYGGSGMSKALTARDFGRTSLDLQQLGQNAAQRWAQITQGSVSPYMVTGPAQAAQTERNNLYDMAVKQFKYNVAAAPDPGAAGQFNLQNALGSQAMSFGMGAAMGGMGGGGGGGASSGFHTDSGVRQNASSSAYPYEWWKGSGGG